jgi:hypothetical protein
MPEAQHIDTVTSGVDPVENQIWGANEHPHSGTAPNIAAAFWKLRESFCPAEQRHSKPISGLHIFSATCPNDAFEILVPAAGKLL